MASNLSAASKTIVFLGDSLTAGYGLAEESAYPALIQRLIEKDGLDWRAVNAGISGDTTEGGLKRLPWVLKTKPQIVFVALGANDGLRGLDLVRTQKNLDEIASRLKKSRAKVIFAGMQLPLNYGEPYRRKFKELFKNVADKHQAVFFPFLLEGVAMDRDLNLPDGIHPNEKGQKIMAQKIYEFLRPILKAP